MSVKLLVIVIIVFHCLMEGSCFICSNFQNYTIVSYVHV